MAQQLRARGLKYKQWSFTSFDVQHEPKFDPALDEYLIFGKETCPDSGRQHFQGYVCFKNRQYLSYCKKRIPGAHFERSRGTPTENREYCSKDGEVKEFGSLPSTGRGGGIFADAIKQAENGDIDTVKSSHPGLYLRYKKTLESLRRVNTDELNDSCGIWMFGPPRSGKDYAVMSKFKSLFNKPLNKWWDGYTGEEAVLLSDLDKFHATYIGYYLKIWADRYPFTAEVKGGTMKIRPRYILVTSNYKISDIFENMEMRSAIEARFHQLEHDVESDNVVVLRRPTFTPSDRFLRALENVLPKESSPLPEAKASTSSEKTPAEEDSENEFQACPKKTRLQKSDRKG
uniref:Replication-associated protein n=1 Tax=Luscinia calliope CRESS-DNA-virus sp. TaxID=2815039 RepID=A0A8A4XCE9_9VIRU|nr:MAG: replication-associated protein [Luscinia calliope CRESS-DNA-virus sp.]